MPGFDDEPPTKPDRPVECPRCKDPATGLPTGRIIVRIDDGKRHRMFPQVCPVCRGSGRQGGRFCRACAGAGETRQEKLITAHLPKNIRDLLKLEVAYNDRLGLHIRPIKRGEW